MGGSLPDVRPYLNGHVQRKGEEKDGRNCHGRAGAAWRKVPLEPGSCGVCLRTPGVAPGTSLAKVSRMTETRLEEMLDERFATIDQRFAGIEKRLARVEGCVISLQKDVAIVKHAITAVLQKVR